MKLIFPENFDEVELIDLKHTKFLLEVTFVSKESGKGDFIPGVGMIVSYNIYEAKLRLKPDDTIVFKENHYNIAFTQVVKALENDRNILRYEFKLEKFNNDRDFYLTIYTGNTF